jgi:tRNA threonylcarbamoyladenosine biosynthesis protein TsaB
MKILAIDSSGLVASVAIAEDDNLLGEYTVNFKKTHSQTLLPMLAEVAKMIELDKTTIDAIAVSGGPGSFTGLRIGSATAKGIGLALDKPLIHVPTLDALAYNLWGTNLLVCPLMDARRQQVYTGIYEFIGEELQTIEPQCAIGIDALVQKINALDREVIFLGDGADAFAEYIKENCVVPFHFAPAHMNKQKASSIVALGKKLYEQGCFETAAEHRPDYLRLSQAERERQEKERDFRI